MRTIWHWLRRGHLPEWFHYEHYRLCAVCDVGTPRGSFNLSMVGAR